MEIQLVSAERVTVTGQRLAERMALQRKQSADNLIETLNANDVGKLPDQNVAEAVRRLPGVSVANDQGEGRYVIIRGAPPALANVTINGHTAAAPEPDSRQVKLDDIPTSLVGALTVVKSLTPDLDANAIAGAVDISTLSAFDRKDPFVYGRAAAGHYGLSGKSPYEGDVTLGTQFGNDQQYGLVLSGNYSIRPIESENFGAGGPTWTAIGSHILPSTMQVRDYTLTRERAGAVANFDWKATPDLKLFLRTTYSSFSDDEIRDRFTVNLPTTAASFTNQTANTGNFTTGGRAIRYVRAREEDDHTLSFSTGANWVSGENVLDWQATFSEAIKTDPRRDEWQFRTGTNVSGNYDLSSFLYIVNPDATAYDPSKFAFNQLVHAHRQAVEHLYQTRLDYERALPWGDSSSIKLGMKYLNRNKTNDQEQQTYAAATGAPALTNFAFFGKPATYDGRYTVGPRVSYGLAENYFSASHPGGCDSSSSGGLKCDANATASASASGDYKISEEVVAGYAMATLKFGQLTVIPGVRIEGTSGTYDAKGVRISSGAPVITPLSQSRSYTDIFPGVNARYDLTEDLVLRAAVTTAIGRPDYSQLPPFAAVDTTGTPVTVSAGNPGLQPLYSTNIDLAAEYYLPNQGIISLNLFHKDISNPIYSQGLTGVTGTFGGIAVTNATVSSFVNARSAHIQGVEFNIQSQFAFLPEPFDGLGASGNISIIDSHANGLPGRTDLVPLFNQSRYVGTAQLFYEKYGVNLRLAYSYRSKYLDTLGGGPLTDAYTADLGQLDARGSYDISEHVSVFLEAANINDAPWRRYIGLSNQAFENERYDWSGKAGIQVKF
jgi:TonB-dependent receptor